jgi:hypothetical protein
MKIADAGGSYLVGCPPYKKCYTTITRSRFSIEEFLNMVGEEDKPIGSCLHRVQGDE